MEAVIDGTQAKQGGCCGIGNQGGWLEEKKKVQPEVMSKTASGPEFVNVQENFYERKSIFLISLTPRAKLLMLGVLLEAKKENSVNWPVLTGAGTYLLICESIRTWQQDVPQRKI